MAATSQQKLAALKRLSAARQGQARDALGRWASTPSGQQAGKTVRTEAYKAGIGAVIGTAIPHAELASGLLATATDALVQKVVQPKQADAIAAQAGSTVGSATHTPEQSGLAKALNAAMGKLPELAAKVGTTQLLGHGIHAVMTQGLGLDAGASAMVSHVAAAAIEPHARRMASSLYQKLKKQAKQKYAPAYSPAYVSP